MNCWMCLGWEIIHPVDTGEELTGGGTAVVWRPSIGTTFGQDRKCPACWTGELLVENDKRPMTKIEDAGIPGFGR